MLRESNRVFTIFFSSDNVRSIVENFLLIKIVKKKLRELGVKHSNMRGLTSKDTLYGLLRKEWD